VVIDLRLGRWEDALADVERVDVILCDPPFSERVHQGQRTGSSTRKTTLTYDSVDESWVSRFVGHWAPRTEWWFIVWSDHLAQRWYERALMDAGWYVFAPVIWLRVNPPPRLAGDGPTSAADYLTVARRCKRLPPERVGSRPGYYLSPRFNSHNGPRPHPGSKDLVATRSLIRDYTVSGDLICDPCAGGGTTLLAAAIEGRRAIGAEMDPETYQKAQARLAAGYTPDMFTEPIESVTGEQGELL
jgi:site-specific DNA-methyltransferase (adenine-specific)